MAGTSSGSKLPAPTDGLSEKVRAVIQDIKRIVGDKFSDDDIYLELKEKSMDPNDTVLELLAKGAFTEEKRGKMKKRQSVSSVDVGDIKRDAGLVVGRKNSSSSSGSVSGPKRSDEADGKLHQVGHQKAADETKDLDPATVELYENQNVKIPLLKPEHMRVPQDVRADLGFGFGKGFDARSCTFGHVEETHDESAPSPSEFHHKASSDDASSSKQVEISDDQVRNSGSDSPVVTEKLVPYPSESQQQQAGGTICSQSLPSPQEASNLHAASSNPASTISMEQQATAQMNPQANVSHQKESEISAVTDANPSHAIVVASSSSNSEFEQCEEENQPDVSEIPGSLDVVSSCVVDVDPSTCEVKQSVSNLRRWTRVQTSCVEFLRFGDREVAKLCRLSKTEAKMLKVKFTSPLSYFMQKGSRDSLILILPNVFFILEPKVVYMRFHGKVYDDEYTDVHKMVDLATIISKSLDGLDFVMHSIERVFVFTLGNLRKEEKRIRKLRGVSSRMCFFSNRTLREIEGFIYCAEEVKKVGQECYTIFEGRNKGWYLSYFVTSCEDIVKDFRFKVALVRSRQGTIFLVVGVMASLLGALATSAGGYLSSRSSFLKFLANGSEYLFYIVAGILLLGTVVYLFF